MLLDRKKRTAGLWVRLTRGLGRSQEVNPAEEWEDLDEESLADTDTDGGEDPIRNRRRRTAAGENLNLNLNLCISELVMGVLQV